MQDVIWTVLDTTFSAVLLTGYAVYLGAVFNGFLGWMVVDAVFDWAIYWRALAWFAAVELLGWFGHVAMHKIPAFWQFHSVHDSQTQMNPFTISRIHAVEHLVSLNIRFVQMFILQNSLYIVLGYFVVHKIHDAAKHSNIKLNFGWLR